HLVCAIRASFHALSSSSSAGEHRYPRSFPTRRSSDLKRPQKQYPEAIRAACKEKGRQKQGYADQVPEKCTNGSSSQADFFQKGRDRKSTRLNSSHVKISYAVFCLKKKTTETHAPRTPA